MGGSSPVRAIGCWSGTPAIQRLGRPNSATDRWVKAIGVLPDGRVVTGEDRGLLLVWDPGRPEAGPTELGHLDSSASHRGTADGRVVTSGDYGPLLVWDPRRPGAGPTELSRYGGNVHAIGALADGRVVTVGRGRLEMLIWDPDHPEAGPAELGHHDRAMAEAVAVLANGRVVAGDWGGQGPNGTHPNLALRRTTEPACQLGARCSGTGRRACSHRRQRRESADPRSSRIECQADRAGQA